MILCPMEQRGRSHFEFDDGSDEKGPDAPASGRSAQGSRLNLFWSKVELARHRHGALEKVYAIQEFPLRHFASD